MVAPARAIQKKKRQPAACHSTLVGRRVQVPEEVFGMTSDGDGSPFFFAGTVKAATLQRMLIRFDYTGEEEWHASVLVRRWLEPDLDPLIQLLSRIGEGKVAE